MPYLYFLQTELKAHPVKLPLMTLGHDPHSDLILPPLVKKLCSCSYLLSLEEGKLIFKTGKEAKAFYRNSEKEKKALLQDGDVLLVCQNHLYFSNEPLTSSENSLKNLIRWEEPLYELLKRFLQPSSPAELCHILLNNALLLSQAECGFILTINDDASLSLQVKAGITETQLGEIDGLLSDPVISQALRTKKPLWSHNPSYTTLFQASPIMLEIKAGSAACLPILSQGSSHSFGILFLLSSVAGLFDSLKSPMLELITKIAALALKTSLEPRTQEVSLSSSPTPVPSAEIASAPIVALEPEQRSAPASPNPIEIYLQETAQHQTTGEWPALDEAIHLFRDWYIQNTLRLCSQNRTHAAKILGISIRSMFRYVAQSKGGSEFSQTILPLEESPTLSA
ncbi:MAG: GAF domain-containing protein [Deltaproteobacteria bacterium]|nr:GAF domain-containing protein [Deltaproteobacteria bacterium]